MASAEPSSTEQSPPRTTGNSPSSMIPPIRSARRREYAAIAAAWHTPSPGRHSPGSYRGGVRQPASRASRRVISSWSRSAPGAFAQPGTDVSVGGRSPRFVGASRTAIRRMWAGGSEEGAGQRPASRGDRWVVRTGDGEQGDQVPAYRLAVLSAGAAHQVDQSAVGPLGEAGQHLHV